MSPNLRSTVVIDGVRYYADRPPTCKGCYFWKNNKVGCILGQDNCYYLAEAPRKSRCDGCPYAKGRPCVSPICYRDLQKTTGGGK